MKTARCGASPPRRMLQNGVLSGPQAPSTLRRRMRAHGAVRVLYVPTPRLSQSSSSAANAFCRRQLREPLRPLLQTWLDENLREIVERLVREEIARVVGEAGLR